MFCTKCGHEIPDGSEICPACQSSVAEPPAAEENAAAPEKKSKKPLLFLAALVICAAAIFVAVNYIGRANLKKALTKEWFALENSIIKVLDIGEDSMEYRLETGISWLDTTVGTYDWMPVSHNKIKVSMYGGEYELHTIEFTTDEKDVITITPAITSTDDLELWVSLD